MLVWQGNETPFTMRQDHVGCSLHILAWEWLRYQIMRETNRGHGVPSTDGRLAPADQRHPLYGCGVLQ